MGVCIPICLSIAHLSAVSGVWNIDPQNKRECSIVLIDVGHVLTRKESERVNQRLAFPHCSSWFKISKVVAYEQRRC